MPAKRSMKQIEKQQRRKAKGEVKEKVRFKKTIGSLDIPEMSSEELMSSWGR